MSDDDAGFMVTRGPGPQCPWLKHKWDTPEGRLPSPGRKAKCLRCLTVVLAYSEEHSRARTTRLLRRVLPDGADLATEAILAAAMREAIDVTHEVGTEEATDATILQGFWDAIRAAARHAPPAKCEWHGCSSAASGLLNAECSWHQSVTENDD